MNLFNRNKKCLIWAIIDNRTGNKNQILAVLKELKLPYKIIKVEYNWLGNLPNFILQLLGGFLHIKNFKQNPVKKNPNLIISCGRRTFPISNKLKSTTFPTPLFIHLMYPKYSLNINKCNLIFTPNHDKVRVYKNIVKTIGSPGPKIFSKKKLNPFGLKPIISLFVGGDHGRYKLHSDSVNFIIENILKKINDGTLLISTSRRTPNIIINSINNWQKKSRVIKIVFHPKTSRMENPIYDMLSFSDEIVVTGDSVSMISQACQYKKPVRVFYNSDICSSKHILFCESLIKKGFAFPFETLLKKCNKISSFNTTEIISKKILSLIV